MACLTQTFIGWNQRNQSWLVTISIPQNNNNDDDDNAINVICKPLWNASSLPLGSHTFGGVLSVCFGSDSGLCCAVAHRSAGSWLQEDGGHTIHPESSCWAPSSSSDIIPAVMPLHKATSSASLPSALISIDDQFCHVVLTLHLWIQNNLTLTSDDVNMYYLYHPVQW